MRQALVAGLLAFVYLALGASPAHFWLDSGELGTAGATLGVMHPPGAPGLAPLLRLATIVPIGTLGFRMSVMSAVFGAISIAGIDVLLARRGVHPLARAGAVLWILAGWTFVRQARVVEIYTFGAALSVVAWIGLDPAISERWKTAGRCVGVFAAAWAAWCFGDLRLALGPIVAIAWGVALARREAWARYAPLMAVAATTTLLALPVASVRGPVADWGDPETLAGLWDHLMADTIRTAFADEILPRSLPLWRLNAERALDRWAEDLGPLGPAVTAIALLGSLVGSSRSDRLLGLSIAYVVIVELVYAIGINPMGIEDRQTLLVLGPLGAWVVAVQADRSLRGWPRLRWGVLPLAFTLLVLPAALQSVGDARATTSWMPHSWTRSALEQLPPGGLLIVQSDDLAAGVFMARHLEGARPDVVTVVAQHLHKPAPEAASEREVRIFAAAAEASDETGRIVAAMRAHDAAVALELPGTSLFEAVPFWPRHGRLPLRVAGPGVDEAWVPSVDAAIERWSSVWNSDEDRERVAVAIASHARGLARIEGDLAGADLALQALVRRVSDRHASALVALAALRDRAGDGEAAIGLTRAALEVEPGRSVALTNLALYLSRDASTRDEALAVAERAVALRPWRADVWQRLADVRETMGDLEGAEAARREAGLRSP